MISNKLEKYYHTCLLIRKFEQKVEELFLKRAITGTTHGCIGQEIIPAVLLDLIDIKKDSVTGNHRSHGHYLSLFADPKSLFCELMGKEDGVIKGKGGSQHLYRENFYTNGITGGMIPVATGIALTEKLSKSDNIVVAFLGDGAMNEGYVSEAFNFASVNDLPILFVLENNQYAISTHYRRASAGLFTDRLKALEIKTFLTITTDINFTLMQSEEAIDYVRYNKKPAFIQYVTYRLCGHSKSDKCEYKDKKEEKYWMDNDPLIQMEKLLGDKKCNKIKQTVNTIIEQAVKESIEAKYTNPVDVYKGKVKLN